jgi:hypothetical protein
MRISRSILECRAIAFHMGVCHLCEALSEQTQLPDCAWASAMKAFHDVHDNLFGNITIAIVVPLAMKTVFILVLRFLIARQWQSDCDHDGSRPTHVIPRGNEGLDLRGIASMQVDR